MADIDAISLRVWCAFNGMEVRFGQEQGGFVVNSRGILRGAPDTPVRATEAELQELLDRAAPDTPVQSGREAAGWTERVTLAHLAATVSQRRR
jgi:hypothetical protein